MWKNLPNYLATMIVSAVLMSACEGQDQQTDMADLTDFAARYAAAWSNGDPVAFAAFYAEDGTFRINDGEPSVGRETIADWPLAECHAVLIRITTSDR